MVAEAELWTAKMLETAPDDALRREVVRGRVVAFPPGDLARGRTTALLIHALAPRTGRGELMCGAGFHLESDPDTVLGPSLSFVRSARAAQLDGAYYPKVAPDLAIEVLALADTASHMLQKLEIYLKSGVAAGWIIDPKYRRAEIHRPSQAVLRLGLEDALEDADLLPGLRIPLRDLFGSD